MLRKAQPPVLISPKGTSRREALRKVGALGLFYTAGSLFNGCSSDDRAESIPGVHRFRVGDFTLTAISDGTLTFPSTFYAVNASPEEVENVLSQNNLPAETVTNESVCLLIDTGRNLVLVDTGFGAYAAPGAAAPTGGRLQPSLRAAGIRNEDIDTVVLTHAHPDHIGANVNASGGPLYPNARYLMWKSEWDYWIPLAQDPAGNVSFQVIIEQLRPLQNTIQLLDREGEIVPGVRIIAAPGHTPGHIVLRVNSRNQEFLHTVDAAGHYLIATQHPEWYGGYDLDGQAAVRVRRELFDYAADNRVLTMGYHFPFPGIGYVSKNTGTNNWTWQATR